ncbi:hypothetical protein J659_4168, partial [Acinetobacter baumannii 1406589]
MSIFNEIDICMPLTILGYYYDKDDNSKNHAHFKENCILKLDGGLTLFVTTVLQKSDLEKEIQERMQVLSKCTETDRELLSTWHDIDPVINLFINFTGIIGISELIDSLKQWKSQGVQEVAFDWYKKIDSSPKPKQYLI